MGRVAGVFDDPPVFPYLPPGVDVLEGGKLTSNNVAGSSQDPLQSLYTGAGHIIRISSKSLFISLISFKK